MTNLWASAVFFYQSLVALLLVDHIQLSPKKRRDALKTAIFTNKSKIFIKAKLTVSKSCLLGLLSFMIFCILRDAHI